MTKSPPPLIDMRGIWSKYRDIIIHKDLDFSVKKGEIIALIGGSGSGKTTLLREILGLLKPTKGTVRLFDTDLTDPDPLRQQGIRRRMGVLFQQGALFSALSVYDNIAFPLRELRFLDEEWIRCLVFLKLAMVEMEPKHAALMPAELSGGMIKRVALARALALEPELLLLDEPTAGLDPVRSRNFARLIRELQESMGFTIVLITHDIDTIRALDCDIAVLAEQRILLQGALQQILEMNHPATRQFFREQEAGR